MINLSKFLLLLLLLGCTSDIDKAKQLGFSSAEQMKSLNAEGYKNYSEFLKDHPYDIQSNDKKFAEVELGKPIAQYRIKSEDVERGDYFMTSKGITLDSSNNNTITKIVVHCSDKFKIDTRASINEISCGASEEEIKKKLGEFQEYCTPSYGYDDIHYLYKNNAFFEIQKRKLHGVELYSFGLVESSKEFNNRHEYDYIDCKEVKAQFEIAESRGFDSIHMMKSAEQDGYKNNAEWQKHLKFKRFADAKTFAKNDLEKSLIIHASTPEDFRSFKEKGGLEYVSDWRGYWVQSIEISYRNNKASLILLSVNKTIDFKAEQKLASVNNIKNDLVKECGTEWELGRASDDDAYLAENEYVKCRFYKDTRRGGMFIEIITNLEN
jgi:hypothetical protein